MKILLTGKDYDDHDYNEIINHTYTEDSLDVYDIGTVSNKAFAEGQTAFDLINETYYNIQKFKTTEDKIRWICENFEGTQIQEVEE
jgi:hypothetical protein